MDSIQAIPLGTAYWPALVGAGLLLIGVWLGHAARQRGADLRRSSSSADGDAGADSSTGLVYTDAPTVRLQDTKRIDRLHKVLHLRAGEEIDLLDLTFDRIPRLRISLRQVQDTAVRVHVELGGAHAGCGSLVKEVATNEFLVPIAGADEHRSSILYFHGKDEMVNFLRIKLTALDTEQGVATIDVLHVCGRWSS